MSYYPCCIPIHRPAMYYGYDVTSGMYIIVRKPVYKRYDTEPIHNIEQSTAYLTIKILRNRSR